MARVVSFRWREGFLVAWAESGSLVVEGGNSRLRFDQREVAVEGLFQGVREHLEGRRGERKTVYIDFAFPLRGRGSPGEVVFNRHVDTYVGSYGLSYTVIEGVGYYLTIYPPVGSLYEYAVVSEDAVAIVTLSRRRVYVMEEDGARRIILV